MSNFVQRFITSIAIVCIVAGAVTGGIYTFFTLLLAINVLGLEEFRKLHDGSSGAGRLPGLLLSFVMLGASLLIMLGLCDSRLMLVVIPAVFLMLFATVFSKDAYPFRWLAITFLGIICITVPLILFMISSFLYGEGSLTFHPAFALWYFSVLWAGDTGAYISGKVAGRRPLWPRISPHKTWEGAAGGLLAVIAVLYAFSFFAGMKAGELWQPALLIFVSGMAGDLIKSKMKRSAGVKDSGVILPGHGGILDRFDSLLGSAPFVFLYLVLSGYYK